MGKRNSIYGIVSQEILRSDRLTWKGKLVYSMLTTYKNRDDNKCFPSFNRLVKDLHVSKNTAIRGIKELLDAGIITREAGKNNSNIYTISSAGGEPPDSQVVQEMHHSSAGDAPQ